MSLESEIKKRRTFAIISHPDAGKTTLTEKFLLYGGAINLAGSVKGKKTAKHAVSDWMEIEKERGISVTSSVFSLTTKATVLISLILRDMRISPRILIELLWQQILRSWLLTLLRVLRNRLSSFLKYVL